MLPVVLDYQVFRNLMQSSGVEVKVRNEHQTPMFKHQSEVAPSTAYLFLNARLSMFMLLL
jgi:hypothetical protein